MKEVLAALCLLRSSPNLQRLEIIVSTHIFWLHFSFISDLWLHLHICFYVTLLSLSICLVFSLGIKKFIT